VGREKREKVRDEAEIEKGREVKDES
jgi:hypothetical protein